MTDDQLESLVVAVLAVSAWPPVKVFDVLPRLRAKGLLDPGEVVKADVRQVAARLVESGYDRGHPFTTIYAARLQSMMMAITEGKLDPVVQYAAVGNRTAFLREIQQIHGVGPRVAENAWYFLTRPETK
jgi:hypothetical protein